MARHEQAKGIIGQALSTVEGVQIRLEPLIPNSQRRNDIRITASRASGLASQEFDLTIVSFANQAPEATNLPPTTSGDASALNQSAGIILKYLGSVVMAKRYPQPSGVAFRAPRFHARRYAGEGDKRNSQGVESALGQQAHSFLLRRPSLCLVRARARTFEF